MGMLRLLALLGCAALAAGFGPVVQVGAKSSMKKPTCAEDECYAIQTKTCQPIATPYVCKMGDPSGMCGKYVGEATSPDEPLGHCYFKKSDAYTCNENRKSCAKAGGASIDTSRKVSHAT